MASSRKKTTKTVKNTDPARSSDLTSEKRWQDQRATSLKRESTEGEIPDDVRILDVVGHRICVNLYDAPMVPQDPDDDIPNYGTYDEENQNIDIVTSVGADALRETLFHEVFHTVDQGSHLEMSEHQVRVLARQFLKVGYDNPRLIAWLFGLELPNEETCKLLTD